MVLKRPDMPSILIEAGFISNPKEARRLTQLEHQEKLSRAIADGIEKYFLEDPPVGTLLAAKEKTTNYLVKKGDTLSQIAIEFGVTTKTIRQINSLTTSQIKIGQKLVIPVRRW